MGRPRPVRRLAPFAESSIDRNHRGCPRAATPPLSAMLITWISLAVLLFWAVGAYNRLVRLRSAALQAFGALDAHLVRMIAMLGEYEATLLPERDPSDARAALWAATTQFGASLAAARARPLDGQAAAALQTADQVLDTAWQAAVRAGSTDASKPSAGGGGTDGAPARPSDALAAWAARREQHVAHNTLARQQFNDAVAHYNGAIAQFPASVLAWLFGFHKARPL